MAGAPCPLPHALHANLLVMDELGGAVLRRSDGLHQREELCLDARTGRCDHHLLGGPQRQSSALRVEGQGQRYPAQNRRRQTRARRWPCPMQLYFRYITLAVTVSGSFHMHLAAIYTAVGEFREAGITVL